MKTHHVELADKIVLVNQNGVQILVNAVDVYARELKRLKIRRKRGGLKSISHVIHRFYYAYENGVWTNGADAPQPEVISRCISSLNSNTDYSAPQEKDIVRLEKMGIGYQEGKAFTL